jgi:hypothetical protein
MTLLNRRDSFGIPTRDLSIIDLAITNRPDIFSLRLSSIDLSSDHTPLSIYCDLQAQIDATKPLPKWNSSRANWEQFDHICDQRFHQVYDQVTDVLGHMCVDDKHDCIDQAAKLVVSAFNSVASQTIPISLSPQQNTYKPNNTLIALNHEYVCAHNKYKRLKQRIKRRTVAGADCNDLQNALAKVSSSLATAKAKWDAKSKFVSDDEWEELCRQVETTNRRVAWKLWHRTLPSSNLPLNAVTAHKDDTIPSSTVTALNTMATCTSLITSSAPLFDWNNRAPPPRRSHKSIRDLEEELHRTLQNDIHLHDHSLNRPITLEEVKRACKQGNPKTAPGPDHLPASFLRHCPMIVHQTLRILFAASWEHGVLSDSWKTADAFCIYKKSHRSDPSSYRVISITSIIIRTFERIVKERITKFLEASCFFHPSQAGFRSSLSTMDHIYQLQRAIFTAIHKRKRLPTVFLDIIKAFDRVPHDRLLYKLYVHAGISGKAWGWLQDFLSNRTFRITQGSLSSRRVPATAGVPQGAVLSPLLFIIFINDLALIPDLQMSLAMFADDVAAWPTVLTMNVRSQFKQMRLFLQHVSKWSMLWGLEFSFSKTNIVTFTRKRTQYKHKPLRLCNKPLSYVSSYKYLGIHLDVKGGSSTHIKALLAKSRHTAYFIGRLSNRVRGPSPLTICRLVKAVLIPQITYAFSFLSLPVFVLNSINQIIATPLRKALGFNKHTSALRTLWEFGIPMLIHYLFRILYKSPTGPIDHLRLQYLILSRMIWRLSIL